MHNYVAGKQITHLMYNDVKLSKLGNIMQHYVNKPELVKTLKTVEIK